MRLYELCLHAFFLLSSFTYGLFKIFCKCLSTMTIFFSKSCILICCSGGRILIAFFARASLGPSLPEPAGRSAGRKWDDFHVKFPGEYLKTNWNHHLDLVLILRERNKQKKHVRFSVRILPTHTNHKKNMLGLQWTLRCTSNMMSTTTYEALLLKTYVRDVQKIESQSPKCIPKQKHTPLW